MTSESIFVRNSEMPEAGLPSHLSPAFENSKKHTPEQQQDWNQVCFVHSYKSPERKAGWGAY